MKFNLAQRQVIAAANVQLRQTGAVTSKSNPECGAARANHQLIDICEHVTPPIQRMILSMGDLESMRELATLGDTELSRSQEDEAGIISDAVRSRAAATSEDVVRFAPSSQNGPLLSGIKPNEELRIIAHGEYSDREQRIFTFGEMEAAELAQWLVKFRLPKEYAGVIFLSGCHSAVGRDFGFLGEFYSAIFALGWSKVKVRGTMGASVTQADGSERVLIAGHVERAALLESRIGAAANQATTAKSLSDMLINGDIRGVLSDYLKPHHAAQDLGSTSIDDVVNAAAEVSTHATMATRANKAAVDAYSAEFFPAEGDPRSTVTLPDDKPIAKQRLPAAVPMAPSAATQ